MIKIGKAGVSSTHLFVLSMQSSAVKKHTSPDHQAPLRIFKYVVTSLHEFTAEFNIIYIYP